MAALMLGGDAMNRPAATLEAAGPIELRVAADFGAPVRARIAEGEAVTVRVRQGNWVSLKAGEKWGWSVKPALRERTASAKP